jgi:hypothetical protein
VEIIKKYRDDPMERIRKLKAYLASDDLAFAVDRITRIWG